MHDLFEISAMAFLFSREITLKLIKITLIDITSILRFETKTAIERQINRDIN